MWTGNPCAARVEKEMLMLRSAVGLLFLVPLLLAAAPEEAKDQVTVKAVKYDELAKIVRSQRGQVLLIDFWGLD
jgi:hypothetical protein